MNTTTKAKRQAYYKQHKDTIRAYQKSYYEQNKESILEKSKTKYQESGKEYARTYYLNKKSKISKIQIAPITVSKDSEKLLKFERLCEESKIRLYNIAYSVVGNKEMAEDVLQDAFIKAWRKFDEFDQNKKFSNWMTTIVKNSGIDTKRTKARQHNPYSIDSTVSQLSGDKITPQDIIDPNANLFEIIERKELILEISQLIDELPRELIEVAKLNLIDQYSYSEISDLLKLNLNKVRSRIHQAKIELRKSPKIQAYANF